MTTLNRPAFISRLRTANPMPRIGCTHPGRLNLTAYGDPAEQWHCPGCSAWWSTPWTGEAL